MARSLPTVALDDVRVASPCSASWQAMKGDDRVRFCGSCEKNVYDLSALTRDEAEDLIRGAEGRLCVRFYRRRDGTVLTQDCPVGLRAVRRRLALLGAGLAAGLSAVAAFVGLRGDAGRGATPPGRHAVMGNMELPERTLMGRVYIPGDGDRPLSVTPVDDGEMFMGDMAAPDPEEPDPPPR